MIRLALLIAAALPLAACGPDRVAETQQWLDFLSDNRGSVYDICEAAKDVRRALFEAGVESEDVRYAIAEQRCINARLRV